MKMLLRRLAITLDCGSSVHRSAALLLLPLRHREALLYVPHSYSATRSPLHRRFAVHTQPPAPSSDDDSKKKATEHEEEENENVKTKSNDAMANDDSSSSDPWRHFQAFSGMDEYMDVTLIHYKNNSEGGKKGSEEEAHKPQPASNAQKQTKD